ncbi:imelysin family protein [Nonlabens sp.]
MNFKFNYLTAALLATGLVFTACSDDDDLSTGTQKSAVTTNYANLVLANYQDALIDAQSLETALQTFTTTPTDANFTAAKNAWFTARESYGTTEAFRFANGPIDTGSTEDIEGYLNSWPMDEAHVDYVDGDLTSGIINNPTLFPTIDKNTLINQNGNGGEEKVSIGYHAIEFLLWGQDNTAPSAGLPGQRPFTDFVDAGTASNQDRRRTYINVCADLITDHLEVMIEQWTGDYKNTFLAQDTDTSLTDMINSVSELSRSELAIERMSVALQNQDQEDEHSCFSDNTDRDIRLNLEGIVNVYNGSYSTVNGASLKDIITEADSDLGAELDALLATAITDVEATLSPFDLAIVNGPTSTEGIKVQNAVRALVAFGDRLLDAKVVLGLN